MQTYLYEGRNRLGEKMKGRIESANPRAVAKWLIDAEIAPIRILPLPKPTPQPEWFTKLTRQDRVPILQVQLLTRQLGNMVRAGTPLLQAIEAIQRSTENRTLARILLDVRADLDRGSDLSSALGRHPSVFDPFYVNMVRVGEAAGKLDDAFRALFRQIEFDREIQKRVKSAVRYPTFVISALAIAVTVLMVFVIPTFAATYKNLKAELPLVTQALIAISNFMRSQWWVLILAILAGAFVFHKWTATPRGHYIWDRTKARLPIIGTIISKASVARFCRNFAMASRAGVPLVSAVELAASVAGNEFFRQRLLNMRRGLERGETLTRVATTTGVFSPLELQMIGVGEASGELNDMMDEVAHVHSEDVTYEVAKLSESVEPILLAVMGVMVGTLLLGVFLPLWSLGQTMLHPTH
jgi:MSHA biogenesis protein MshG